MVTQNLTSVNIIPIMLTSQNGAGYSSDYLKNKQFKELVGRSRTWIYSLYKRGILPASHSSVRAYLLSKSNLERYRNIVARQYWKRRPIVKTLPIYPFHFKEVLQEK